MDETNRQIIHNPELPRFKVTVINQDTHKVFELEIAAASHQIARNIALTEVGYAPRYRVCTPELISSAT